MSETRLLGKWLGGNKYGTYRNSTGIFTEYVKSGTNSILYLAQDVNFIGAVDNVSVEEVGWAGSQALYDGLIAQSYTAANAAKEAAMWCHYNNDTAVGAIYGKLYNWFAVKLLQDDIDAYNTANPTTPWGWHVPTMAEFITLQTALGGSAVAGGKMKVAGLSYWQTPNTGADNSSGFSALGGGKRIGSTGVFTDIIASAVFNVSGTNGMVLSFNSLAASNPGTTYTEGRSLRLLKD